MKKPNKPNFKIYSCYTITITQIQEKEKEFYNDEKSIYDMIDQVEQNKEKKLAVLREDLAKAEQDKK